MQVRAIGEKRHARKSVWGGIDPAHQRDLNADDLPWLLLWPLKRPIDASNNIVDPNVNRSALRAS
jgi:hypothetical protein